MMDVVIYARDPLIFRDGRPFGEFGAVRSGAFQWPMPSTVAGMLRSRIGLNRDSDFFEKEAAAELIRNIRVAGNQPACRIGNDKWRLVYPRPADVIACQGEDGKLTLHGFNYVRAEKSGVTLPWKNWLIPLPGTNEKPSRNQPGFWHEDAFMAWLSNTKSFHGPMLPEALGWPLPHQDHRVHCAIDGGSGTVAEGQLWTSSGLCMRRQDASGALKQWGIAVRLEGHEDNDQLAGAAHLGGDRRLAFIEEANINWPSCSAAVDGARFLRIILITPGAFGGWAPDWLMPASPAGQSETPWVKVPGTSHEVRLRSAFVPRWMPVSGWDYDKQRPKAMRKLIPAGAVYLVEVKDATVSKAIATHLSGKPLHTEEIDGFGICMVGRADINS